MPSDRSKIMPKRPWHALVKRNGVQYHLGYFKTLEEAYAVEAEFAASNPPRFQKSKKYVPASEI